MKVNYRKAEKNDLEDILCLQYRAYQSEAEALNDYTIQPLMQTMGELEAEYAKGVIYKAVYEGKIIGSVRGFAENNVFYIGKLMVEPEYRGKGIGTSLLKLIEEDSREDRKELFTSDRSSANLRLYKKHGYEPYKTVKVTEHLQMVYLRKEMVSLRDMSEEDIDEVLHWNKDTEKFLMQWSNFEYPLTKKQYIERIESDGFMVLAIEYNGEMVGTIQSFGEDKEQSLCKIGCFLLNPKLRGKGIGTIAMKKAVAWVFQHRDVNTIRLAVWNYNIGAQKCYKNCGYVKVDEYTHPCGEIGCQMEIYR